MKKFPFLLVTVFSVILFLQSCEENNGNPAAGAVMADSTRFTSIQWIDSIVNFGTINKGEQIKVAFHFRNTGNQPLFLASVRAGCGCTVPEYSKEAIAPGKEGTVTGAFDSNKAHAGEVRKTIFVTTNTKGKTAHTLIFTGQIREAAAQ